MRAAYGVATFALMIGLSACTRLPRPAVLSEADAVLQTRTAKGTATHAPQAFAHAQQLRERAEAAYDSNQLPLASELGTHALAAFQRAHIQARIVAAQERLTGAQHALSVAREELANLSHRQKSVSAQVEALELRIKVARDAEEPAEIDPASPKREAARRTAAKAVLAHGRLLCVSARMLDHDAASPPALLKKIDALESGLASEATPAPIDTAMRARAACLTALTESRRHDLNSSPASDPADHLMSQLGGALPSAAPTRDDRGIVVAFSEFFNGEKLGAGAAARLKQIAQISKAHPKLPLLVVMHSARRSAQLAPARLQALKRALKTAGAAKTPVYSVDDRLPASVLPVKGSKLKDERVEFVFVAR